MLGQEGDTSQGFPQGRTLCQHRSCIIFSVLPRRVLLTRRETEAQKEALSCALSAVSEGPR